MCDTCCSSQRIKFCGTRRTRSARWALKDCSSKRPHTTTTLLAQTNNNTQRPDIGVPLCTRCPGTYRHQKSWTYNDVLMHILHCVGYACVAAGDLAGEDDVMYGTEDSDSRFCRQLIRVHQTKCSRNCDAAPFPQKFKRVAACTLC